jgi:nitrogen fixation NifU-like protein
MTAGDLYGKELVDHGNQPRNRRTLVRTDATSFKTNPACGDELRISATVDGEKLTDVVFEGDGCLVCLASASMLTERVKGKTKSEALSLADAARTYFTKMGDAPASMPELSAFSGLSRFPVRKACARLAWEALAAALSVKA